MNITYVINDVDLYTNMYRVHNIKDELFIRGISCSVVLDKEVLSDDKYYASDLIIFCRIRYSKTIEKFISNAKAKGIPIVFDIDDLVFELEYMDQLCSVRENRKGFREAYNIIFKELNDTLQNSDAVTCSTEALKSILEKYGKPTYVIPNNIGRKALSLSNYTIPNKVKKERIKIGYFSGTTTHNFDFMEASEAIYEVMTKNFNIEFHIFGELVIPQCLYREPLFIIPHKLTPYMEMLSNIATMDINIAPLELGNIFNKCKSELKVFEASLMGVPTVASNIETYSGIIEDSIDGFLVKNKSEWCIALQLLIDNENTRNNMANLSRDKCIQKFYIENIIEDIINIYKSIAK